MSEDTINELKPQLLGIHALNSFAATNSASRGVMFSSHFTQHLVTNGLEEKIIIAGPETEFAKYTLGVKMPDDGRVLEIIHKYPPGVGKDSINMNPETLVIYEHEVNRTYNGREILVSEIDCFTIPCYRSFHQFFGWPCVRREGMNMLSPGAYIPKGTVFVDTPANKDGNSYTFGRNVPVAYMAVPGVSEDGLVVARSELENWKFKVYDTRVVEWGNNHFPINIYGPNKPFPDIGEYVREDGLLMALRSYDSDTAPVNIGIHDVEQVDYVFDKQTYIRSAQDRNSRGRVIDIEIISNNNPIKNTPLGMSEHANKYVNALVRYYKNILKAEEKLRLERKKKYSNGKLNISPRFNKLLVKALAITYAYSDRVKSDKVKNDLKLLYRKEPIDEYYAKFTVEYELTPKIGDKFSNSSGNKGVICKILEDHEMPVRPDGLRAKMIIDPGPVFHRMNIGQSYEQYITGAAYDVTVRITHRLGFCESTMVDSFNKRKHVTPETLMSMPSDLVESCYKYLMDFYRVFNDIMPNHFENLDYKERCEHLSDVINEGICKVYIPVDNKRLPYQIILDLERLFQPTRTKVKYVDQSGKQVETVKPVRIGWVYMMLLDKLAGEWSATSTARLQHFGILSSVTKSEKFAYPYRNSPTRISGETESRIFAGYTGPETIAEMFDRTNNPITRRNIYWNLLDSNNPSQIGRVVDRDQIPLGASRPIQIINHIFMCAGFKPIYLPENF